MPPAGEDTSAARPALATAGGVVLALAVLQIGERVIDVFDPRPAIQAALVVAVGLAALAGERRRQSGRSLRGDPLAVGAGLGCLLALAVAGTVWATSGFSTPPAPSIGEQLDDVRAALRASGAEVTDRRVRLREGPASHLIVAARRDRSDEVRIYDEVHGRLRRRLGFRTQVRFPESERPVGAHFRVQAVRDLDGDGQREILGDYETNLAGEEKQRAPVLIRRSSGSGRYSLAPVLPVAAFDATARAGLQTLRLGRTPVFWVTAFALDPGGTLPQDGHLLATSVVLPRGDPHRLALTVRVDWDRIPRRVRFWTLQPQGTRAACVLEPGSEVFLGDAGRPPDLPLGRPLADAMIGARVDVGDYKDGRCLEAGS